MRIPGKRLKVSILVVRCLLPTKSVVSWWTLLYFLQKISGTICTSCNTQAASEALQSWDSKDLPGTFALIFIACTWITLCNKTLDGGLLRMLWFLLELIGVYLGFQVRIYFFVRGSLRSWQQEETLQWRSVVDFHCSWNVRWVWWDASYVMAQWPSFALSSCEHYIVDHVPVVDALWYLCSTQFIVLLWSALTAQGCSLSIIT